METTQGPKDVERIVYVERNGHRVLVATIRSQDPDFIVAAIGRLEERLQFEPDNSLRAVLDDTGGRVTNEGSARWKLLTPLLQRKILKGAIVSQGLKRTVTGTLLLSARMAGMSVADRVLVCNDVETGIAFASSNP